jgi:hypothetical protein
MTFPLTTEFFLILGNLNLQLKRQELHDCSQSLIYSSNMLLNGFNIICLMEIPLELVMHPDIPFLLPNFLTLRESQPPITEEGVARLLPEFDII